MRRFGLLTIVASLALSACSAASQGGSPRGDRNLITAAEIQAEGMDVSSAYQVVERLRWHWMRSVTDPGRNLRVEAMVFVNGRRRGGLPVLRSLLASEIVEMRYLPALDATTRFGTGYPAGVILVEMRGG